MRSTHFRRGGGACQLLVLVAVLVAGCGGSAAAPSSAVTTTAVPGSPTSSGTAPQPSLDAPSMDLPAGSAAAASQASDLTSVDPCSLITPAEANAVAGVKTGDPMPEGEPPVRCVWPTPTSGAVGQVEIGIGDGAKKAYDIDHDILKHDFTPIPGLGDEAYSETSGAVFFRLGDTWVALNVVRLDDETRWMPKLVTLAKTVAGRLGA